MCLIFALSGALIQYGIVFVQIFFAAQAKGFPLAQSIIISLYQGVILGYVQGVGILYAVMLYVALRIFKKWERDAASMAPLLTGDTRTRSASADEIRKAGLFANVGSFLAFYGREMLRVGLRDRTIIAPQGSGKGVSVVIPALLSERRAVVTTDMKGENLAVSNLARVHGGRPFPWRSIYVADPFGLARQPGFVAPAVALEGRMVSVALNPFDTVDISDEDTVDRALDSAMDSLCIPLKEDASASEKHFHTLARTVLRGMVWAGLCSARAGQTFDGELVEVSPAWLRDMIVQNGGDLGELVGWLRHSERYGAEAATVLAITGDRERGSIYTSALNMLGWIEDRNMRRVVSHTTMDWELLNAGLADLFIICPADQAQSKRLWVHGVLKQLFTRLERQPIARKPKDDMLFLLDELGQFGHVQPVEEVYSRIRGYGARIWAVFQRRGQMEVYTDPTVFESAHILQVFGTQDKDTIEWVCEISGKRRIIKDTVNEGAQGGVMVGGRGGGSVQGGRSMQEEEAAVLTADVVRGLGSQEAIALVTGLAHPILYRQVPYFERPDVFERARPNPYEAHREAA